LNSEVPTEAYFVKATQNPNCRTSSALIADEEHWCRHNLALDKNGIAVDPTSSLAVKRCALGAVLAAAYQLTHDLDTAYKLGHEVLAPFCRSALLMDLNDTLGHAAVLNCSMMLLRQADSALGFSFDA
jgi:hypothetical protein